MKADIIKLVRALVKKSIEDVKTNFANTSKREFKQLVQA